MQFLDVFGGLLIFIAIIASAASFNSWGTLALMSLGVLLLDLSLYKKLKIPADPSDKHAVSLQKRQKAEGIVLTIAMVILWISAIVRQFSDISSTPNRVFRPILSGILILMLLSLFILYIRNDVSVASEATQREKKAIQQIKEGKRKKAEAKQKSNKRASR